MSYIVPVFFLLPLTKLVYIFCIDFWPREGTFPAVGHAVPSRYPEKEENVLPYSKDRHFTLFLECNVFKKIVNIPFKHMTQFALKIKKDE